MSWRREVKASTADDGDAPKLPSGLYSTLEAPQVPIKTLKKVSLAAKAQVDFQRAAAPPAAPPAGPTALTLPPLSQLSQQQSSSLLDNTGLKKRRLMPLPDSSHGGSGSVAGGVGGTGAPSSSLGASQPDPLNSSQPHAAPPPPVALPAPSRLLAAATGSARSGSAAAARTAAAPSSVTTTRPAQSEPETGVTFGDEDEAAAAAAAASSGGAAPARARHVAGQPLSDWRFRYVPRDATGRRLTEEEAAAQEAAERAAAAPADEEEVHGYDEEEEGDDDERAIELGDGDADDLWENGGAAATAAAGGRRGRGGRGRRRARAAAGEGEDGGTAAGPGPGSRRGRGGGGARGGRVGRRGAAGGEECDDAQRPQVLMGVPALGAEEPLEFTAEDGRVFKVPGSINKFLRSYQRDGIRFLLRCYAAGHGGILADDMGLGKTVQAISFCAALLGKTGGPEDRLPRAAHNAAAASAGHGAHDGGGGGNAPRTILVVCPTAVVANWQQEFQMWGDFQVVKYHGATKEQAYAAAAAGRAEVVLTTYDGLRRDHDKLRRLPIHAVIYDEAHKLSNPDSKVSLAARTIRTRMRFGLSGTVMPNDYKDIHGLMDLLVPGSLADWATFQAHYAHPIKMGSAKTANAYWKQLGYARKVELTTLLRQKYLLRRDKTMPGVVEQLPKKVDQIVFCELRPAQKRAYRRLIESPDLQLLVRADETCDCQGATQPRSRCCHKFVCEDEGGILWPFYHECDCGNPDCKNHKPDGCEEYYAARGSGRGRGQKCPWCLLFPAINILRAVSAHLDLLRPEASMEHHPDPLTRRRFEFERRIAAVAFGEEVDVLGGLVAGGRSWVDLTETRHCGKMIVLLSLLATWHAAGDKVLIFSGRVRMLDIIQQYIERERYDFLRMDGTVTGRRRQEIVDAFNSRPSVFVLLVSTAAGGVGLNLTAANRVVVFDPSWDPSHDLQAQDRAYRLGQRRDVHVYRLVATGTLEEQIYQRQIYKQQQTNMVVYGTEEKRLFEAVRGVNKGELFGVANLLKFTPDSVETAGIVAEAAARLDGATAARTTAPPPAVAAAPAQIAAAGAPVASMEQEEDLAPDRRPQARYRIVALEKPLEEILAEEEEVEEEEEEEGEEESSGDEEGGGRKRGRRLRRRGDRAAAAVSRGDAGGGALPDHLPVDDLLDLEGDGNKKAGGRARRRQRIEEDGEEEEGEGAAAEDGGGGSPAVAAPARRRGANAEAAADQAGGSQGAASGGGGGSGAVDENERVVFNTLLMDWPDGEDGSSSDSSSSSGDDSRDSDFGRGGGSAIEASQALVGGLWDEGTILHIQRHDEIVGHDAREEQVTRDALKLAAAQLQQGKEKRGGRGGSRGGRGGGAKAAANAAGEAADAGGGPFGGYSRDNPPPLKQLPTFFPALFELAEQCGMAPRAMAQALVSMTAPERLSFLADARAVVRRQRGDGEGEDAGQEQQQQQEPPEGQQHIELRPGDEQEQRAAPATVPVAPPAPPPSQQQQHFLDENVALETIEIEDSEPEGEAMET